MVVVPPRTGPVRIFPIVVIIDLRLRSPQPIGIWRVPYPGTNGFRKFDAALSGERLELFNAEVQPGVWYAIRAPSEPMTHRRWLTIIDNCSHILQDLENIGDYSL